MRRKDVMKANREAHLKGGRRGGSKTTRRNLGITEESTPLEVVEEPPIEEKVVVKKAKVAKKSSFWKGKGK